MKTINQTFTDKEFKRLMRAKENKNWHDFIMQLASHIETIPKASSLSPKRWLKSHKELEWTQFLRLSDEKRGELLDEYLKAVSEELDVKA